MGDKPSPSFAQSLISGGVAGTSVDLLFYPLDTIKTRLQSAQGFFNAGGFRGIYKGVGSVVIGSAPGAAVFFSTYDTLKRISPLHEDNVALTHMLSASIAEVAACLIRVPTEVVKSRAQTSAEGRARGSSLAAARYVLTHDGFAGFYRGFGSTIMREIPFTSLQFPLYEFLKLRLARALDRQALGAHEAALCGSLAGGVGAALTTPLDVVKTRTMLDLRKMSATNNLSLFARFKDIYVKEGVKALFAGVVPRTLWISAGGAVFLGAYEWSVQSLMGVDGRLRLNLVGGTSGFTFISLLQLYTKNLRSDALRMESAVGVLSLHPSSPLMKLVLHVHFASDVKPLVFQFDGRLARTRILKISGSSAIALRLVFFKAPKIKSYILNGVKGSTWLSKTNPVKSEVIAGGLVLPPEKSMSSPSASMSCDGSSEKLLHSILECLEKQSVSKENRLACKQRAEGEKRDKDRLASFRDMCSMFAVISVFVASLGATFLQYVQSAIIARPTGSPGKRTDIVTNGLLFISVFLSIGTTLCVGYAVGFSSVDVYTMRVSYKELVRRSWTMGFDFACSMFKFNDSTRLELQNATRMLWFGDFSQRSRASSTSPDSDTNCTDNVDARDLVHQSATFLSTIIGLMSYSVITLLAGLLVFAWAEQPRAVSILLTAVLAIILGFVFLPMVVTGEMAYYLARQDIRESLPP